MRNINKMRTKKLGKGQISMEYVMTYGWMILIVMIVGIVLWQMGAFTPPSASRGCRGFSQITVLDWKASSANDALQLTLTNEAGTKLRLDDVMGSIDGKPCASLLNLNTEIRPGRTYQANLTNCGISNYKLGEYYRANITIVYRNIGSEIDHNSVGICWGGIE